MRYTKFVIFFISVSVILSFISCEKVTLHGDIRGLVTDAETSEPIQGASVKLMQSNVTTDTTRTGIDGIFFFKNLIPETEYEIEVSKPAYEKNKKNITVNQAITTEINFTLNGVPYPKFSVTYLDFGRDSTFRSFTISNIGKGNLQYSLTKFREWITVYPATGDVTTETDTVQVTINRTGLSENKYEETISIISYIGDEIQQDTVDVLVNGVMDQDGNYYGTVKIGTQIWMNENLNTGIMLWDDNPEPTDNGKIEKGCYDDLIDNCDIYGGLYTWPEMMDYNLVVSSNIGTTQGICPTGWHIPTVKEWRALINYVGGKEVAGGKLKATGTTLWMSPNFGASNESGFTALPGGWHYGDTTGTVDHYTGIGMTSGFWTSDSLSYSPYPEYKYGIFVVLHYDNTYANDDATSFIPVSKTSVRCIKD